MAQTVPEQVDTCIIGNGPSALILSYILHGHIPIYTGRNQDALLHSKLTGRRDLLHLTPDLYAHFQSSLRYSTQALPINTLLDTLLRPNADTEANPGSLVEWKTEPHRAISHVALGNARHAGGQWVDNPVSASWEIGTLSYAVMLSLPGYSFSEHYEKRYGRPTPDFQRPSRTEVADYYATYPHVVEIAEAIRTDVEVLSVRRSETGFVVGTGTSTVRCQHVVLGTGIFSVAIPPPQLLQPLLFLSDPGPPVIVIGSGFSAADVIVSLPPTRKVLHLFKWNPGERPSPLKGCHRHAYPEYAGIYQQMKEAASAKPQLARRRGLSWLKTRNWNATYEGLPNAEVVGVRLHDDVGNATVDIRTQSGTAITRTVGGLAYVVGRRGSLDYLDRQLRSEFLPCEQQGSAPMLISGKTLRQQAEVDLEVAPDVFIIGSLAGDSLVRHAFGSCVYAAGRIMGAPWASGGPPATPVRNASEGGIWAVL